jgi:WD40 repeat protein
MTVNAVAISPDQRTWLAPNMGVVHHLDPRTGDTERSHALHDDLITDLIVHPDGERLVSAGWDKRVRITRLADGGALCEAATGAWVTDVDLSPDGAWMVAASTDAQLSAWRTSDCAILWSVELPGSVDRIAALPDGSVLAQRYDELLLVTP